MPSINYVVLLSDSLKFIMHFNSQKFQYYNGNWNGNDCNDPLTTFETIAYKLEDLVAAVKYKYFNEDNEYFENDPKLLKKLWSQTDNLKYGRCFTLVPTSDHIKLGIQQITIRVSSDVELFFHTPEMFLTTRSEVLQEKPMQSISLGCSYDIGIKRDLFKMINDENICMAHTKYSKDQCAYKEIDKKSLEYFGCTSPYGPNKTKICPNSDIGLNVTKLYEDTIEKHNFTCLNPCSFLSINAMKTKDNCFTAWSQKKSYINILFQETIKVTTGYYLYNGLTLFAQIGGYIGLGRTIVWAYDKTVAFVEQSKLILSKHQQKSMIA